MLELLFIWLLINVLFVATLITRVKVRELFKKK